MVSFRFAYAIRFEVTVQQTTAETTTTIRMWIILTTRLDSLVIHIVLSLSLSPSHSLLHTCRIRTLHSRYLCVYKYTYLGKGATRKRAKFNVRTFQVSPSASSIIFTYNSVYLRKQYRKALKILYIEHKEEAKRKRKGARDERKKPRTCAE